MKNAKENTMNASLRDELESNEFNDQKGKKVIFMAFPPTIQGSSDSPTARVDAESYEKNSNEGLVRSCSQIVSHDTLVRNCANARSS